MNLKALTDAVRQHSDELRVARLQLAAVKAALPAASTVLRASFAPVDQPTLVCINSGGTMYVYATVSNLPGLKSRMAMRRHMRLLDNGWEPAPWMDCDEVIDDKPARTYGYTRRVSPDLRLVLKLRLIVKGDSKSCRVIEEVVTHTRETKVARVICA